MATEGGCEMFRGRGGGMKRRGCGMGEDVSHLCVYVCMCVGSGAVHHRPVNGIWES